MLSPGKVPMETKFDDVEGASADEVHAKEFFVKSVNRGGLIEPSDALYVTCIHAIMSDVNAKNILMSSDNPTGVFVKSFFRTKLQYISAL